MGLLIAAWAVRRLTAGCRWSVPGVILLALTGLGSILGAATSMQCDPGTSARCANDEHTAVGLIGQLLALHADSGLLEFAGSAAGAAVPGATLASRWRVWGRLQITLGITLASCGLVDLLLLLLGDSIGTAERVRVVLTSGWCSRPGGSY